VETLLHRVIGSHRIRRDPKKSERARIGLAILSLGSALVGIASALDLRVNWTESMPRGLYQRMDPTLERDAWVAVCLEGRAAEIARERGYVIHGSCASGLDPILKRLVGVPGDRIEVAADGIAVNGVPVPHSDTKDVDARARPLEHTPKGEIVLSDGHFFVMGMNLSRSWDSRYFGAIGEHQIIASARPLWTF